MSISLRYLLLIRLFAMTGLGIGLAVMHGVFDLRFPVAPVATAIAALAGFSLWSWSLLKRQASVSEGTLLVQLIADMAALAVVVYFTGGSVNPFIWLFILPVVFAAAGMRLGNAALVAVIAFGSYTALMFFHRPLTEVNDHGEAARLHLWGMWYGFAMSAALVAFFVARIARALRRQDQALAAAREERLRADQAIALGTLAAGTAHELATPLSTMVVLSRELEAEHGGDAALAADLALLRGQVDRCKAILDHMAADAGELQAREALAVELGDYLARVLDDWRLCRPETAVEIAWRGPRPACRIAAERTLTQALTNILQNAADAASAGVCVEAGWDAAALELCVTDDGPGVAPALERQLGHEAGGTKRDGMGIGLLLAQTVVSRLGGAVSLRPRADSGTIAEIRIPLERLKVPAP